jgi:hypothetical protein
VALILVHDRSALAAYGVARAFRLATIREQRARAAASVEDQPARHVPG